MRKNRGWGGMNLLRANKIWVGCVYFFVLCFVLLNNTGCATVNLTRLKYDRYNKGTVEILVNGHLQGSGWFASQNGEIITAAHVIKPIGKIEAIDSEGRRFLIKPIAADIGNDMALLKPETNLYIKNYFVCAEKLPSPGEMIWLIGTPLFRHNVAAPGWVARDGLTYEYSPVFEDYTRVYHIAGNTPKGFSGGCWIDKTGKIVGVQSGMMVLGDSIQGFACATPPDAIKRLLTQKKSASTSSIQCAVEELWEQSVDLIKKFPDNSKGVIVAKITKDGVSERAGLKKDDLIISVNGKEVQKRDDFFLILRSKKKGDIVTLDVISAGKSEKRIITIPVQSLEEINKMDLF